MAKAPKVTADAWINQIFQAKAAQNGGIVRRQITSVTQFASSNALEKEVKKRGFHMFEIGQQYVIFCNTGHFRAIC